jgi:hypothetical protein
MNEQSIVLASALVGRQRELANARRAVEGALGGSGVLVVVTGEAGIGKTRLVDELTKTIAPRCQFRRTRGPGGDLNLRPLDPQYWPCPARFVASAAV